ncbi:MAG TPA: hypothetical protein VF055_14465 [Steroidobacteraceae bacterium]|jgi:hypothetical protein
MPFPKYIYEADFDLAYEGPFQQGGPRHVTGHIEGPSLQSVTNELARRLKDHPYADISTLHVDRVTGEQWIERLREQTAQGYPTEQFELREQRLQELWARECALDEHA